MVDGQCANIYGEAIQRAVGHWMQKHRGATREEYRIHVWKALPLNTFLPHTNHLNRATSLPRLSIQRGVWRKNFESIIKKKERSWILVHKAAALRFMLIIRSSCSAAGSALRCDETTMT